MENSLYAYPYTPQDAIIRPYTLLYTCTRGSITHRANVPRLTPRFRATRARFFPFCLPLSFQRDLALLIDSNGFVDFIRSSKSSIVTESFGKVTQLGGLPRAKNHDELLFNRLKMFSRFTRLLFAIGSFQRSSEYVKGESAKD